MFLFATVSGPDQNLTQSTALKVPGPLFLAVKLPERDTYLSSPYNPEF
jgi:hypothetical protein